MESLLTVPGGIYTDHSRQLSNLAHSPGREYFRATQPVEADRGDTCPFLGLCLRSGALQIYMSILGIGSRCTSIVVSFADALVVGRTRVHP